MHFVYVDDSGDADVSCFSALIIPADQWRSSLEHLMGVRRIMGASDGIYIAKEIHSTDWLAGKGRVAKSPFKSRIELVFMMPFWPG